MHGAERQRRALQPAALALAAVQLHQALLSGGRDVRVAPLVVGRSGHVAVLDSADVAH